jgi:hypothetical protein
MGRRPRPVPEASAAWGRLAQWLFLAGALAARAPGACGARTSAEQGWPDAGRAGGETAGVLLGGGGPAVLGSVEPRSVFFGRQVVALRNVSLVLFDAADRGLLCASEDAAASARLEQRYGRHVVILAGVHWQAAWDAWQSCPSLPWENFLCRRLSAVTVTDYYGSSLALLQFRTSYHGWFGLTPNPAWPAGTERECDNFEGVETEAWDAFLASAAAAQAAATAAAASRGEAARDAPLVQLRGDVLSQPNHYAETLLLSPVYHVLLRYGAALATFSVFLYAARQWALAFREGNKPALQFVLLWNALTMGALGLCSAIDGLGTTGNFGVQLRNLNMLFLFGQGCALNLLICDLWAPVLSNRLKSRRNKHGRRALGIPRSRLSLMAYFVIALDIAGGVMLSLQLGSWLVYAQLIPATFLTIQYGTSYYLMRQAYRLHKKLTKDLSTIDGASDGVLHAPSTLRERQLQQRLVWGAALVAVSSVLSCVCIASAGAGLLFINPTWFLLVEGGSIYSRALTGLAQVHFCSRSRGERRLCRLPWRAGAVGPSSDEDSLAKSSTTASWSKGATLRELGGSIRSQQQPQPAGPQLFSEQHAG